VRAASLASSEKDHHVGDFFLTRFDASLLEFRHGNFISPTSARVRSETDLNAMSSTTATVTPPIIGTRAAGDR
jgi:hypothetical protein